MHAGASKHTNLPGDIAVQVVPSRAVDTREEHPTLALPHRLQQPLGREGGRRLGVALRACVCPYRPHLFLSAALGRQVEGRGRFGNSLRSCAG